MIVTWQKNQTENYKCHVWPKYQAENEVVKQKTLNLPKWKPNELIRALLQITIDTDETTDRDNAPTVPSWNRSPSPIFFDFRLLVSLITNPP